MSKTSPPSPPSVEVLRPQPQVALIVLNGEHDLASAPKLAQTLDDAVASSSHLIVDLSTTEFIDSSTILVLVKAKSHADNADCAFNLVLGTTPIVERALEISNVLPSLNRVTSTEHALAARQVFRTDLWGAAGRCARERPRSSAN
jgi:anti-sigma B factor antagonist